MDPETVTLVLVPTPAMTSLALIVTEYGPVAALRLAVIFKVAVPLFEPIEVTLRLAFTPRGKLLAPIVRLTGLFVVPLLTSVALIEADPLVPLFTLKLGGNADSAN
jgi:hypothetical protein